MLAPHTATALVHDVSMSIKTEVDIGSGRAPLVTPKRQVRDTFAEAEELLLPRIPSIFVSAEKGQESDAHAQEIVHFGFEATRGSWPYY